MTRRLVATTLFLLSAVVCVTDTANYHELSAELKTYVDRAIRTGNDQLNYGHLNFDKMGPMKEILYNQVRIDVRLRATTCGKASGSETHRSECPFKRTRVRCMVCGCPDRPSIDCVNRSAEDGRFDRWNEMCKPAPPGPPTCPGYVSSDHPGNGSRPEY